MCLFETNNSYSLILMHSVMGEVNQCWSSPLYSFRCDD